MLRDCRPDQISTDPRRNGKKPPEYMIAAREAWIRKLEEAGAIVRCGRSGRDPKLVECVWDPFSGEWIEPDDIRREG